MLSENCTLCGFFIIWISFQNVSGLIKILYDSKMSCAGLICEYSYISWNEKTDILKTNNKLRNEVASGKYNPSITAAANINKLAWSEKLAASAQDEANKCPESKQWGQKYAHGNCEYVASNRIRQIKSLWDENTRKNFTSFITQNKMLDFEITPASKSSVNITNMTFRRGNAFSIGCGYTLRYHSEQFTDYLVCMYCYLNEDYTLIPLEGNYSCQSNCLYHSFTCDDVYSYLCSYNNTNGYMDEKQKYNRICPSNNLLTRAVLMWNFIGENLACAFAIGLLSTTVVITLTLSWYIYNKYYPSWRNLFAKKDLQFTNKQTRFVPNDLQASDIVKLENSNSNLKSDGVCSGKISLKKAKLAVAENSCMLVKSVEKRRRNNAIKPDKFSYRRLKEWRKFKPETESKDVIKKTVIAEIHHHSTEARNDKNQVELKYKIRNKTASKITSPSLPLLLSRNKARNTKRRAAAKIVLKTENDTVKPITVSDVRYIRNKRENNRQKRPSRQDFKLGIDKRKKIAENNRYEIEHLSRDEKRRDTEKIKFRNKRDICAK